MKTLLFILLLTISSTASAYCVHYNIYGQCDQQDQYSQGGRYNEPYSDSGNVGLKPLPVIPPLGTSKCQWVMINGQYQSVCR